MDVMPTLSLGILVTVVCILCYGYGRWRRRRGLPVGLRDQVWLALLLPMILLPAVVLPSILESSAMTLGDRMTAVLAAVGIGALPFAVGLVFAGTLRLSRWYVARARSAAATRRNRGTAQRPT